MVMNKHHAVAVIIQAVSPESAVGGASSAAASSSRQPRRRNGLFGHGRLRRRALPVGVGRRSGRRLRRRGSCATGQPGPSARWPTPAAPASPACAAGRPPSVVSPPGARAGSRARAACGIMSVVLTCLLQAVQPVSFQLFTLAAGGPCDTPPRSRKSPSRRSDRIASAARTQHVAVARPFPSGRCCRSLVTWSARSSATASSIRTRGSQSVRYFRAPVHLGSRRPGPCCSTSARQAVGPSAPPWSGRPPGVGTDDGGDELHALSASLGPKGAIHERVGLTLAGRLQLPAKW